MSGEVWTLIGVLAAAVIAVFGGLRSGLGSVRTATASEVTALGQRLDAQAARIDKLERTDRALRIYIAEDHELHRANGWPVTPLPPEIA